VLYRFRAKIIRVSSSMAVHTAGGKVSEPLELKTDVKNVVLDTNFNL